MSYLFKIALCVNMHKNDYLFTIDNNIYIFSDGKMTLPWNPLRKAALGQKPSLSQESSVFFITLNLFYFDLVLYNDKNLTKLCKPYNFL